jgi:hypothetical protein
MSKLETSVLQHTLGREALPKLCAELLDIWRRKCFVQNLKAMKWTSGVWGSSCKAVLLSLETSHLLIQFSFIMLLASQPFYASGCESCKVSSCNKTYPREHNMEIRHKICAYDYEWPRGLFPTAAAKDLITRILVSAKSRPTPDDIIEDLFFTQELDKHLHLERCRRAGVGRNDMGDIFPCVGGICSGYFWASPFQSGL